MKYLTALACVLLVTYAPLSAAHDAKHADACSKEGAKISDTKTRNKFLAACLKKIDMTTFQMEEKAEQCDQNALNKKLEGLQKDQYLEHCYLEGKPQPQPKEKTKPAN